MEILEGIFNLIELAFNVMDFVFSLVKMSYDIFTYVFDFIHSFIKKPES